MVQLCLLCAWSVFGGIFWTCGVCVRCAVPASSQHNLYDIYLLLCVQYYTLDDGQRNCPKHVEFYYKNKFEKLVHLVGFIVRIGYIVHFVR